MSNGNRKSIKAEIKKLGPFSKEFIEKAPLRQKIVIAYHNEIIEKLLRTIKEHRDEPSLFAHLKLFLAENWSQVRGTCISYTSIPEAGISKLICSIAEQVYIYEKAHGEEDEVLERLHYLMPDMALDSNSLSCPNLGTINKTHFSEKEKNELSKFILWFEANGGIPTEETAVSLSETEHAYFNSIDNIKSRLSTLNKKKALSKSESQKKAELIEDLAKAEQSITKELRLKWDLEQRFKRWCQLSQKQKEYEAEQQFIRQGVYKQEGTNLVWALPFEQIIKTHIENGFGDALIPLAELIDLKEHWSYSSTAYETQQNRLTELTKEEGLIATASRHLKELPPALEDYHHKEQELSSYIEQANKIRQLLSDIKSNEMRRLKEHSAQSRSLLETRQNLDKLKTDNSHLLGHLLTLRRRLKYSDSHSGKGRTEDAASDAYQAIIEFNVYYTKLDPKLLCLIQKELTDKITELLNYGSHKNSYNQGLTTCIGLIGESLEKLIKDNEAKLAQVTNSPERIAQLINDTKFELKTQVDTLQKDIATHKYVGQDSFPITKALLEKYQIKVNINSDASLKDLMSLEGGALVDLLTDGAIKTQAVNHIAPDLDLFVLIQPLEQLIPVMETIGQELVRTYLSKVYKNRERAGATELYNFIEDKNKQSLLLPLLLSYNGLLLEEFAEEDKNDKKTVLNALIQNGLALQFASATLRNDPLLISISEISLAEDRKEASTIYLNPNDRTLVLKALRRNRQILKYSVALKNDPLLKSIATIIHPEERRNICNIFLNPDDKKMVLVALKKNRLALHYASARLKDDPLLNSIANINDPVPRGKVCAICLNPNNRTLVKEVLNSYGLALQYASEECKNDKKMVLYALMQDGLALQFASARLKNKAKMILKALKQNGFALQFTSDDFKNDKKTVLAALKNKGLALQYASVKLRGKKKIVLEAIQENGLALKYASPELQRDKEIVIKALIKNGHALQYASDEFKNDPILKSISNFNKEKDRQAASNVYLNPHDIRIISAAIKENGLALRYASYQFKNDRAIVLKALRQNIDALQYATDQIKSDKQFIFNVIKYNQGALQYACDELRNDKTFILLALENSGLLFKYASAELKNDKEFVLTVIKRTLPALQYISAELSSDREFILEVMKHHKDALTYVASELKWDRELISVSTYEDKERITLCNSLLNLGSRPIIKEAIRQKIMGFELSLHQAYRNPLAVQAMLALYPECARLRAIKQLDEQGKTILHASVASIDLVNVILSSIQINSCIDAVRAKNSRGNPFIHEAIKHPDALLFILSFLPKSKRQEALLIKNNTNQTVERVVAELYPSLKRKIDKLVLFSPINPPLYLLEEVNATPSRYKAYSASPDSKENPHKFFFL